jgi:NAD+ kinase
MMDGTAGPRLACVQSGSPRARAAYEDLATRYRLVPVDDCDAIVALGGDGFLLDTMHAYLAHGRPIFGMNRGTVGFLMNAYSSDALIERVAAAKQIGIHPLAMAAAMPDGRVRRALAFNEVSATRHAGQTVNLRITVDGIERLAAYAGDGVIIATAAGSTAYNLSAHGPIIPIGSNLLALTPVSPFRPRRWRGALLPDTAEIVIENLDPAKRPLAATADKVEFVHVHSVTVREDPSVVITLLFDPNHTLEERIIAEQFAV